MSFFQSRASKALFAAFGLFFAVGLGAVIGVYLALKDGGTAEGLLDSMQTRDELYSLLEYRPGHQWSFPG